ncbi:MAG: rhodanese-like domain-containing protein [bacterium]|nr:rhodanese-like domain-containing protein [bacterium]
MAERAEWTTARETEAGPALLRSIVVILLAGTALGLLYNALGPWGLEWKGRDLIAEMADVPAVQAVAAQDNPYYTENDDPLAVAATNSAPSVPVPQIPEVGRPVPIPIAALKQLYDAQATVIIDAREPSEYAAGHIAGAIHLSYDMALSEPERLAMDTGGLPIVVYCGGGTCDVSHRMADELMYNGGHTRVAVYEGGFPEWSEAGFPVEQGTKH